MEWAGLAIDLVTLAMVGGIAFRFGRWVGIVDGHESRIGVIEAWRNVVSPPMPRI